MLALRRGCLPRHALGEQTRQRARAARCRLPGQSRARRSAAPPQLISCSATGRSSPPAAGLDQKSEDFIDLFERASTPLGTLQRAEAALAATQALIQAFGTPVEEAPPAEADAPSLAAPRPAQRFVAPAGAAVIPPSPDEIVTLDSVLGDGGGGGAGGSSQAPRTTPAKKEPAPRKAAPGPSFWEWSPPQRAAQPEAQLQLQLQPQKAARPQYQVDLPFAERDETSLPRFQSEVELPELQSVAEAPSWQEALAALLAAPAPPEQTAEGAEAEAVTSADISGIAERLRAAAEQGGVTSGVAADGARWWLESGVEEQENGRLCRWWIFRGVSADGGTEWEEKTWETSDAFSYKEIGAEKSGRDSLGRVWREAWTERHDLDAAGVRHIWRSADKWAKAADQSQWHEKWNESFGADGRTERDAYKWGCLPPNETPQDGHAARWCEKWGEKWDGAGFASKWADKWGERDSREGGGQYRKWGDKWSQEFRDGKGHRWGETWGDDPDGRGWYSRKWGEDHFGGRQVRKWGHATDGESWDTVQEEDTWYEANPNFSWADAYRHSPQLLSVKPRIPGSGPGDGDGAAGAGGATQGLNVIKPLSLRKKKPKSP